MSTSDQPSSPTPAPSSSADFWSEDWLNSDPSEPGRLLARLWAAERLRVALCSVPFYAKAAEDARLRGDEMGYWLSLKSSEATLLRP